MTPVPRDVHREVLKRDDRGHPVLYALWIGEPHAEDSELLGRAQRLPSGRWWRAFTVTGEFDKIRLMSSVITWLLAYRDKRTEPGNREEEVMSEYRNVRPPSTTPATDKPKPPKPPQ